MWYIRVAASLFAGYWGFGAFGWWAAPLAFLGVMIVSFPLQMLWEAAMDALFPHRRIARDMATLFGERQAALDALEAAGGAADDEPAEMRLVREMLEQGATEADIRAALPDEMSDEDADSLIKTMKAQRAHEARPDFLVPREIATEFADHLQEHGLDAGLQALLERAGVEAEAAKAFLAGYADALANPAENYPPNLKPNAGTPRQRAALSALIDVTRQSLEHGFAADEQALRISYGSGVDIRDVRHLFRTAL